MFEGFSPETIDFLWGIRMNNNREWFLEHKKDYVQYVYEPMKALGQDLFELFRDRPGNLLKVSRIYRDARLHHPQPYKESLWICIRRDVEWWGENPCLYLELNPDMVHYGFFWWKPRVAVLEAMRREWADQPGQILELIRGLEESTGTTMTAELYKRPKPAPVPELERFYAWKGNFLWSRQEPVNPELFGPELGKRAAAYLEKLIPLYEYFNRFCV